MDHFSKVKKALEDGIEIISGVVAITRHLDMVTVEIDPGAVIQWIWSDDSGCCETPVQQVFPEGAFIRFADEYCELDSVGPVQPIIDLVNYRIVYG